MTRDAPDHEGPGMLVHASCIALEHRCALILGQSGSGKSALALQLMAFGALLVSDDRTELTARDGQLLASAPASINGLIEARGVGILRGEPVGQLPVALAVDLDEIETERLPPFREYRKGGVSVPLLHKVEAAHFPAAVLQYLKGGRRDPE